MLRKLRSSFYTSIFPQNRQCRGTADSFPPLDPMILLLWLLAGFRKSTVIFCPLNGLIQTSFWPFQSNLYSSDSIKEKGKMLRIVCAGLFQLILQKFHYTEDYNLPFKHLAPCSLKTLLYTQDSILRLCRSFCSQHLSSLPHERDSVVCINSTLNTSLQTHRTAAGSNKYPDCCSMQPHETINSAEAAKYELCSALHQAL